MTEKSEQKLMRKCMNCRWQGQEKQTKGSQKNCPICGDSTESREQTEARLKQEKETALEYFKSVKWQKEGHAGIIRAVLDTNLIPVGDRILFDAESKDCEYLIEEIFKPFPSKDIIRLKLGKSSYIDLTREQVNALLEVLGKSRQEIEEQRRIANEPTLREGYVGEQ